MKKPSTILNTAVAVLCAALLVYVNSGYAATKTNTSSGNWSAAATWGGTLPSPGDDIIIASGTSVVMDSAFSMASLTIQSSGSLQFDNMGYGRTVTVTGNVSISGSFLSQGTGTFQTVHSLYISGNLAVTGSLNFAYNANKGYCNTYFINTTVDQTITGGGSVQFRGVILAKGSVARKVTANFDVTVNGLPISFTQSPANPNLSYGGTYEQTAGILYHNVPEFVPSNGRLLFTNTGGMEKWQYELNINGGALEMNTTGTVQIGTTRSNVGLFVTGGTVDIYAGTLNIQGQMKLTGGTTTLYDGPAINIDPQALAAASTYNLPATQNAFEISGSASFSHSGTTSATIRILNPIRLTGVGRDITVSGSGTVSFDHVLIITGGGSTAKTGGDGFQISNTKSAFYDLEVNTGATASVSFQGRDVALVTDISISHGLTITTGKIVTSSSYTVTLEGSATLTETPGFEVWGQCATTRTLTANSSNSFGGIGVTITIPSGPGDPGSTLVQRKTGDVQTGLGNCQSILRYFDITPSGNNTGLNAGMVFAYNADGSGLLELNGASESGFKVFQSTNLGTNWVGYGTSSPDYTANTVTVPSGINDLSRWTVSGCALGPIITTTDLASDLNPACENSSVTFTATVTPSTATGTIQFKDGATNYGLPVTLVGGQATLTTSTLSVGSHTMTAEYSGDGSYSGSTSSPVTQVVNANPVIALDGKTDVLCHGDYTGAINISVSSGASPYAYLWSPNGETTQDLTDVIAGTYSVTVTDANNCTATGSWTLTEPAEALAIVSDEKTDNTCFGQSNGSIDMHVTGGTQPYAYYWSPGGETTEDLENLPSGSYHLTVTDAHQCTSTFAWYITQPSAELAITLDDQQNVSCFRGDNGSIDLTVNGGTPNYSYYWSPGGETTQDLANLIAGTYSVTVTDAQQCVATGQWVITQPDAALEFSGQTATDIACFGNDTGEILIDVTGGTLPYAYLWSPGGETTQNLTGLTAGSYAVTVTDAHGCTLTDSWTLTQPAEQLVIILDSKTNVACNGNSTGAISISVNGGTPGYSYLWSAGGLMTQDLTGLVAGEYTVTVTDAHNCTQTGTWEITQPAAPLEITLDGITNVACNGNSTGAIDLDVTGGTEPYTYTWSPGGMTTEELTGIVAGTYYLTVTDAHQCSTAGQWTVTEPAEPLEISEQSKTDVLCHGNSTGAISLTVEGGTPDYAYLWSPNGETTPGLSNLIAGTYSVVVTDAHGCTVSDSWTITEPAEELAISLLAKNDIACYGDKTGSIDIDVAGGTTPYTYYWTPGDATTQDLADLGAGTYTVVVTDAHQCSATETWVLTEPAAPLTITFDGQTDIQCNGGSNGEIEITPAGGTLPYTYLWAPNGATTEDLSDLVAGTYSVTVTDAHGCTSTDWYEITQPAQALAIVSSSHADVNCFGNSTGSITIDVEGGTTGYTFLWSPNGETTQNLSNLPAGSYSVVVTDAHACTATDSWTITEPAAALALSLVSKTDVACFGNSTGAINIDVSGGTLDYTYYWTPGGETTQDLSNLVAGTYTVTVTDAHQCTATDTWVIQEPTLLTVDGTPADVSCYGLSDGSVTITAQGGTPGYTYNWAPMDPRQGGVPSGTYSVTVTDVNNCTATGSWTIFQPDELTLQGTPTNVLCNGGTDGSVTITVGGGTSPYTYQWDDPNASTDQNLADLPAGTYSVTVTDDHGCWISGSWEVTQPQLLGISLVSQTDIACNGNSTGAIDIDVTGGTTDYNYYWSPGGETTQDLTNLVAGSYSVTVTDAHQCVATGQWTLTQPSAPLEITNVAQVDVQCFGNSTGSLDLTVNGGTPPYTYYWSPDGNTTEDLTDLLAGPYNVTITDAHLCVTTGSYTITQPDEALAIVDARQTDINCFGASTGSIYMAADGGTEPYTYLWSPGGETTETIADLIAGTYSVTVTDAHGCTTDQSWTLTQPAEALAISLNQKTDVSCNAGSNGAIDISVTGGTTGYTFYWTPNGATTEDLADLVAGTYTVTVTDAHQCTATETYVIAEPPQLTVDLSQLQSVSCSGGSDGFIQISVAGGTPGYTYYWAPNGAQTQNIQDLTAGMYSVTVTDANSCVATGSWEITQPVRLALAGEANDVSCNGGSNGSVTITVSGGTAPYSYEWDDPNYTTDADLLDVPAGTYTVIVTDDHGCQVTNSWVVTEPEALAISGSATGVTCNGGSDGSVSVSVTGGTPCFQQTGPAPDYHYYWMPGGMMTSTISNLTAGTYNVTVTDCNQCTITETYVVTQPDLLTVTGTPVAVSCYGGSDGSIDVDVTGGTPGYTYYWSPGGETTDDLANLSAGTYSLTVTDSHECSTTQTWIITQPDELSITSIDPHTIDADTWGNSGFTLKIYGQGFKPTNEVYLVDAFGDIDVTSGQLNGAIHFIGTDELDVVFPSGSGFSGLIQQDTPYPVRVVDGPCSQSAMSPDSITVTPGAAAFLVWEDNGEVMDAYAGDNLTSPYSGNSGLYVDVHDAWDYMVVTGSYEITMRLVQGSGTLASHGTGISVWSVNGIAQFPDLWLDLAGTDKILQPYSGSFGSWPSWQFTIFGTYADHIAFTTQPGPPNPQTCTTAAHAGDIFPQQPVVQAYDQYGNPTGLGLPTSCTLTLDASLGTLQGTALGSYDANGACTFTDLRIDLAGTNKILVAHSGTFTDVNSSEFTVCSGPADKLVFGQQPLDARAGDPISGAQGGITVYLEDAYGNPVFDNGIDVAFPNYPIPGGPGTLWTTGAGLTQYTVNGVATFDDLYIDLVGTYTLLPSSPLHPTLTAMNSDPFVISYADPYEVRFEPSAQPSNTPSGEPISPAVQASRRDIFGNYILEANWPLDMSIFTGPGSLYGTTTQNTDANGIATFDDLAIDMVGTYVLNVHDASLEDPGPPQTLPDDYSDPFEIIAGSPVQVVFYGPINTPITAGSTIMDGSGSNAVQVWLVDAAYNLVNQSGVSIYLTLYYGSGALSGTDTKMTVDGIATFDNLWINLAGYKRMQARSTMLGSDISSVFLIDPAAAYQLTFTNQPRRTKVNEIINGPFSTPGASDVTVAVQDQYGNTIPGSGTNITMSLLSGTGLSGTLTRSTNTNGVATFDDLRINSIGYYNLVATSSSFTKTSNLFYISITKDAEEAMQPVPKEYVLNQNYPNPFNPSTTIDYTVPEASSVRLSVFDMLGKEVAVLVNGQVEAGTYHVTWNAASMKSGIYIYRLQAESMESPLKQVRTMKMILTK